MADDEHELEYGPESHVWTYPPAVPCAGCGGSGRIALLVTARTCEMCAGTGQVWPEARHEHVPPQLGYWRRERFFDEFGRVIMETQRFEPAANAEKGPERASESGSGERDGPRG